QRLEGQNVFRILVPWIGTSWNQHGQVDASTKVGGSRPLMTRGLIQLDEPEDGGFFKDVRYAEIDPKAPSQFAASVITVNIADRLNQLLFGDSQEEFDKRIRTE